MRSSSPVARRVTVQKQNVSLSSFDDIDNSKYCKSNNFKTNFGKRAGYLPIPSSESIHLFNPLPLERFLQGFVCSSSSNNNIMAHYVIQGFYYLFRHKTLLKTVLCPLLWSILFIVCVFCVLLPLVFIPQAFFLSTVMSPFLGIPLAFLLALLELFLVVTIFAAVVLLSITDKLFDQVLILRGHADLVAASNDSACCGCCSIVSVMHFVITICTLPLNLIPVVGTVIWLFINGRCYTWDLHSHYHKELKHRSFNAQRQFVKKHWYGYHMFGMQAMALELIPLANVLFIYTNCVGAALWAADMEDKLLQENKEEDNDRGGDTEKEESGKFRHCDFSQAQSHNYQESNSISKAQSQRYVGSSKICETHNESHPTEETKLKSENQEKN